MTAESAKKGANIDARVEKYRERLERQGTWREYAQPNKYISSREAAFKWDVSPVTVRNWANQGDIPDIGIYSTVKRDPNPDTGEFESGTDYMLIPNNLKYTGSEKDEDGDTRPTFETVAEE